MQAWFRHCKRMIWKSLQLLKSGIGRVWGMLISREITIWYGNGFLKNAIQLHKQKSLFRKEVLNKNACRLERQIVISYCKTVNTWQCVSLLCTWCCRHLKEEPNRLVPFHPHFFWSVCPWLPKFSQTQVNLETYAKLCLSQNKVTMTSDNDLLKPSIIKPVQIGYRVFPRRMYFKHTVISLIAENFVPKIESFFCCCFHSKLQNSWPCCQHRMCMACPVTSSPESQVHEVSFWVTWMDSFKTGIWCPLVPRVKVIVHLSGMSHHDFLSPDPRTHQITSVPWRPIWTLLAYVCERGVYSKKKTYWALLNGCSFHLSSTPLRSL